MLMHKLQVAVNVTHVGFIRRQLRIVSKKNLLTLLLRISFVLIVGELVSAG